MNIRNWCNLPRRYESHLVSVVCQNAGMIDIFWRSVLSSRLASVLLCDGMVRIVNVRRWLVMVSIYRLSQKWLGYACILYKNIQWFRNMCLRMVVALHCCIEKLPFEVSRGGWLMWKGSMQKQMWPSDIAIDNCNYAWCRLTRILVIRTSNTPYCLELASHPSRTGHLRRSQCSANPRGEGRNYEYFEWLTFVHIVKGI
jgi:hypothetical protein